MVLLCQRSILYWLTLISAFVNHERNNFSEDKIRSKSGWRSLRIVFSLIVPTVSTNFFERPWKEPPWDEQKYRIYRINKKIRGRGIAKLNYHQRRAAIITGKQWRSLWVDLKWKVRIFDRFIEYIKTKKQTTIADLLSRKNISMISRIYSWLLDFTKIPKIFQYGVFLRLEDESLTLWEKCCEGRMLSSVTVFGWLKESWTIWWRLRVEG